MKLDGALGLSLMGHVRVLAGPPIPFRCASCPCLARRDLISFTSWSSLRAWSSTLVASVPDEGVQLVVPRSCSGWSSCLALVAAWVYEDPEFGEVRANLAAGAAWAESCPEFDGMRVDLTAEAAWAACNCPELPVAYPVELLAPSEEVWSRIRSRSAFKAFELRGSRTRMTKWSSSLYRALYVDHSNSFNSSGSSLSGLGFVELRLWSGATLCRYCSSTSFMKACLSRGERLWIRLVHDGVANNNVEVGTPAWLSVAAPASESGCALLCVDASDASLSQRLALVNACSSLRFGVFWWTVDASLSRRLALVITCSSLGFSVCWDMGEMYQFLVAPGSSRTSAGRVRVRTPSSSAWLVTGLRL